MAKSNDELTKEDLMASIAAITNFGAALAGLFSDAIKPIAKMYDSLPAELKKDLAKNVKLTAKPPEIDQDKLQNTIALALRAADVQAKDRFLLELAKIAKLEVPEEYKKTAEWWHVADVEDNDFSMLHMGCDWDEEHPMNCPIYAKLHSIFAENNMRRPKHFAAGRYKGLLDFKGSVVFMQQAEKK